MPRVQNTAEKKYKEPTSLEINSKSALEQRPSGRSLDFGFARKSLDVDARKDFWKEAVKLLGASLRCDFAIRNRRKTILVAETFAKNT